MDIPIIYEDDDLIVVNKPAGVVVNKAETTKNFLTIQEWAEDRNKIFLNKPKFLEDNDQNNPEIDFFNRGGVVHRLDKETSGILILAKNVDSFADIQGQFKERKVDKSYLALAHGKIMPVAGSINAPVGRLPWRRTHFGVLAGGRESESDYKVISYFLYNKKFYSFLEVSPKTGRTHQIRVHLKYIGHPIFADFLYAGRKNSREDRKLLGRVFLHAVKITFCHPVKKDKLFFEAPLPHELSAVIKKMEKHKF